MSSLCREHSLRLKLLNFPLIVGVVYIHAYGMEIGFAGVELGPAHLDRLTDVVRTLVSQGVARLAVPMFFLISGYFFFDGFNGRSYLGKLRTRCRTLLLPYLFWTCCFAAVVTAGRHLAGVGPYFGEGSLSGLSPWELGNALFGVTRVPAAYHFWFIRDLMLLMLLSPLLRFLLGVAPLPWLAALFLMWVIGKWPLLVPDVVGVLFFSLGGYVALRDRSLFFFDRCGWWSVVLYVPLLFADVVWYEAWFNVTLHRCGIVVGLAAVLFLTRYFLAAERCGGALLRLSGASFFVYAAHEPLLGVVRTVAFRSLPLDTPLVALIVYLAVPLLVILLLLLLHRALGRVAPRALMLVTGGR